MIIYHVQNPYPVGIRQWVVSTSSCWVALYAMWIIWLLVGSMHPWLFLWVPVHPLYQHAELAVRTTEELLKRISFILYSFSVDFCFKFLPCVWGIVFSIKMPNQSKSGLCISSLEFQWSVAKPNRCPLFVAFLPTCHLLAQKSLNPQWRESVVWEPPLSRSFCWNH